MSTIFFVIYNKRVYILFQKVMNYYTIECKHTMYVGGLCRLKYGLLWVPINTFLFAQMSPNLAKSIVRCYSSSCEILKSMRLKLRKMLFFIFIFQMEERFLYFFTSQIRYGVFDIYNLKKNCEKISNIKITNDEYVRTDTTFGTDISIISSFFGQCMIFI